MQFVKKSDPDKSRKRPVRKSKWKREKEREERYVECLVKMQVLLV